MVLRQSIKEFAARHEISLLTTLEASTLDKLPYKTYPTSQSNDAIVEDEGRGVPIASEKDSIPLDPEKCGCPKQCPVSSIRLPARKVR